MNTYKVKFIIAGTSEFITKYFTNVVNTTAMHNYIIDQFGYVDYIQIQKVKL